MTTRWKKRGFLGGLFVLFLGSCTLWLASIAHGPAFDLLLTREVPSTLDLKTLSHALHDLAKWPSWFFSLKEAKIVDPQGLDLAADQQFPWVGALIRFKIEPPKKQWKRFEIFLEVTDYVPGKLLVLKLHSDSTNQLTQLFDNFTWKIEFIQEQHSLLIRGSVSATAKHWRSKLFGAIASRILLNQVFYPNLTRLAEGNKI